MTAATAAERLSQLGYDLVETRLIGLDPSMGYMEYIVRGRRRSDGRYAVWYGIDWTRHPDAGDRANGFTVNQGAYDLTAAESRDEAKRREKLDSRYRWEFPSGKAKGRVSSGASKPKATAAVRYGWEFPDGTVIPADDPWSIKDKLLSMDSFWDRNRKDCMRDGLFLEWYWDWIESDIDNLGPEELYDIYGVRYSERRDGRPYTLPDGRSVDGPDLFEWITEERYTFEDWYQYNEDCYEFEELVKNEAEHLSEDPSEEAMGYYGVHRVVMDSASRRPSKPKGKPKTAVSKPKTRPPARRPVSKASKPKAKVPAKRAAPKPKSKGVRR